MNVNKAIVIGRITSPLELKTTKTGKEVLAFSVATNKTWKDQAGNKQEKTEFHNVVSWGPQAKVVATYFIKGQEIYVEGSLETRSWDDATSGKKMYRTEIIMDKFEFGQKPSGTSNNNSVPAQATASVPESPVQYPVEEINPDDIPF